MDPLTLALVAGLTTAAVGAVLAAAFGAFHPIRMFRSWGLRRTAKKLADALDRFIEERAETHPPPITAPQDSPQWTAGRRAKAAHATETMRLFYERGLANEVWMMAETMAREGARIPFARKTPMNPNGIHLVARELREIAKTKRLVR